LAASMHTPPWHTRRAIGQASRAPTMRRHARYVQSAYALIFWS